MLTGLSMQSGSLTSAARSAIRLSGGEVPPTCTHMHAFYMHAPAQEAEREMADRKLRLAEFQLRQLGAEVPNHRHSPTVALALLHLVTIFVTRPRALPFAICKCRRHARPLSLALLLAGVGEQGDDSRLDRWQW